ncbi:hypothetical protein GCM10010387_18590 [Streptomyces inusitatus]|uniref:Uncharacterized protein n=1 Tax=Streptomyces inusitatus TaxID=68221 RepID=A0A918PWK3_9ACTN|nr:hypothetical protein [Streptomyces inusitatus]GGZ25350.1 hypothetical protein GCM10010387_18590 [Streptomyces inusitatus]
MIWWLKARRIHTVLAPVCLLFLLLLSMARPWTATLPSLAGGSASVRLLIFLPVPLVAALHHTLTCRLPEAEWRPERPVRRMDLTLVLAVVLFAALAGLTIGALAPSADSGAYAVGRNTAFLTGLMLIAHGLFPQAAPAVPIGWVFLSVFLGSDAYRNPRFWSVLEHSATHPVALAQSAAALIAGVFVLLLVRPPTP